MELTNFQIGEDTSIEEIDPTQFDIPRPGKSAGHCVGLVLSLIQYEVKYHQPHKLHQYATLESNAKRLFRACNFGLLAKYYSEPVGLLLTKPDLPTHIDALVVLETVRGRGVGRELIARFRRRYAEEVVSVSVHRENKDAIQFYSAVGFSFQDHPIKEHLLLGMIDPLSQD